MTITDEQLPACAVCNKPVERFTAERSATTRETVFTAYCHGAVEAVSLTDNTLDSGISISMGRAFAAKTLPGQSREISAGEGE